MHIECRSQAVGKVKVFYRAAGRTDAVRSTAGRAQLRPEPKTDAMNRIDKVLLQLSRSDRLGFVLMRVAIAIVFIWIGWLKFAPYEADSITPFVANNPVMSLFYEHPEQYRPHLTREGELLPAQRAWQQEDHTYAFADGLGTVEITIGLLVLCGLVPTASGAGLGMAGAALAFATSFVTLSFLVTTPEAWVPALGDAQHGFPYLSGGGRLVAKDVMLLAGGLLVIADSARAVRSSRARTMPLSGTVASAHTRAWAVGPE